MYVENKMLGSFTFTEPYKDLLLKYVKIKQQDLDNNNYFNWKMYNRVVDKLLKWQFNERLDCSLINDWTLFMLLVKVILK